MDNRIIDTIEHVCEKAFLDAVSGVLRDSEGQIDVVKLSDEITLQRFLSVMDRGLTQLCELTPHADELVEFLHALVIQNRKDIMRLPIPREVRAKLSRSST